MLVDAPVGTVTPRIQLWVCAVTSVSPDLFARTLQAASVQRSMVESSSAWPATRIEVSARAGDGAEAPTITGAAGGVSSFVSLPIDCAAAAFPAASMVRTEIFATSFGKAGMVAWKAPLATT